jgi:hypothetical protein
MPPPATPVALALLDGGDAASAVWAVADAGGGGLWRVSLALEERSSDDAPPAVRSASLVAIETFHAGGGGSDCGGRDCGGDGGVTWLREAGSHRGRLVTTGADGTVRLWTAGLVEDVLGRLLDWWILSD